MTEKVEKKVDQSGASAPSLVAQLAALKVEPAKLDARNRFGGRYASLSSVLDAARKALAGTGLAFTQIVSAEPLMLADGGYGTQLTVTTRIMNAAGEILESRMAITCDPNPQVIGSLITYFRRYGLAGLLGIAAEEDDDGETAADERPATPAAQGKGQAAKSAASDRPQAASAAQRDKVTAFWTEVNRLGLPRERGMEILRAANGDFEQALAALKEDEEAE